MPDELTEFELDKAELAAFLEIANGLVFLRDQQAEQRRQLLAAIAILDANEARAQGQGQGAFQLLLKRHGLEGEWQFDPKTTKLVKVPPKEKTK
jgi:hypothetical protein